MANTALAAWSVKFLATVRQLPGEISKYNKLPPGKSPAGDLAKKSLLGTVQTLLSLRSELAGILATSSGDISASSTVRVLAALDVLLKPLNGTAWLGKGDVNGRNAASFNANPLIDWYDKYIKPLI